MRTRTIGLAVAGVLLVGGAATAGATMAPKEPVRVTVRLDGRDRTLPGGITVDQRLTACGLVVLKVSGPSIETSTTGLLGETEEIRATPGSWFPFGGSAGVSISSTGGGRVAPPDTRMEKLAMNPVVQQVAMGETYEQAVKDFGDMIPEDVPTEAEVTRALVEVAPPR